MKKIVVVGLVTLALIVGFVLIQNARAHGPMMDRGSWWQPSTWNWSAYRPWNNWGYRSSDHSNYQGGYATQTLPIRKHPSHLKEDMN
jgi:hypothetical protein